MINPDKYIRKAYLGYILGTPIYDKEVPKNIDPIPKSYILITSQTKSQENTSKCGHDWNCTIVLDIVATFTQGYADTAMVDDIEESISNVIDLQQDQILIDAGFTVYNTQMLSSTDMTLDTKTQTIIRKIVRYGHQISGVY
jgi:hypothetical protein